MKQDRKPRNKPMHYGQLIYDKEIRLYYGGKIVSSTNGAGKVDSCTLKNKQTNKKTISSFNSIYKKKIYIYIYKCEPEHYETARGKHRQNTL